MSFYYYSASLIFKIDIFNVCFSTKFLICHYPQKFVFIYSFNIDPTYFN